MMASSGGVWTQPPLVPPDVWGYALSYLISAGINVFAIPPDPLRRENAPADSVDVIEAEAEAEPAPQPA